MAYIYPAGFQPRLRGMGSYLRNAPLPRASLRGLGRARGFRRLGQDDPYSDYNPDVIDLPITSSDSVLTSPYGTLNPAAGAPYPSADYSSQGTLPLSPAATVGPSVTNYSPASLVSNPLNYATPALAVAAGIPAAQVQAAFAAQPQGTTISSSTLLYAALAIGAVALFAGGGSGRRR